MPWRRTPQRRIPKHLHPNRGSLDAGVLGKDLLPLWIPDSTQAGSLETAGSMVWVSLKAKKTATEDIKRHFLNTDSIVLFPVESNTESSFSEQEKPSGGAQLVKEGRYSVLQAHSLLCVKRRKYV